MTQKIELKEDFNRSKVVAYVDGKEVAAFGKYFFAARFLISNFNLSDDEMAAIKVAYKEDYDANR